MTPELPRMERLIPGGPLNEVEPLSWIPGILRRSASRHPERTAVRELDQDREPSSLTFAELEVLVDRVAGGIVRALGPIDSDSRPGVAVVGANSIRWALAYLGALRAGCVVVPMDKELPSGELQAIIHYSGARMAFFEEPYREPFEELARSRSADLILIGMDPAPGSGMSLTGMLRETNQPVELPAPCPPGTPAAICYTSGTMGRAKGVVLSHANICSDICQMLQMMEVSHGDVFLSVLPIHHTYECTCGFLGALAGGASVAFGRSLRTVGEDLALSRATIMLGVPLLWESIYRKIMQKIRSRRGGRLKLVFGMAAARVMETLGRRDARRNLFAAIHEKIGGRVRFFISGSAPIDPEVSLGFRKLGFGFLQGYGLTETSPIVSVNRERAFRDASVGLPLPEVQVRIEDCDEEGVGEIVVKGPNVMLGYHNDPEETSKVLRDGWLFTGDFGRLDDDGFLYVTGRKKNVIIAKNGKNVYPEEMETILNRSQLISESMVFSSESQSKGEEIAAILSPDTDAMIARAERTGEELSRDFVAGLLAGEIRAFTLAQPRFKRIASFMIFDGEMAKTTTKKIRRREVLREAGIEPEQMHRI